MQARSTANLNLIHISVLVQYDPNFDQSRTWINSAEMDEQSDRDARATRRNMLRDAEQEEDDAEEVFC